MKKPKNNAYPIFYTSDTVDFSIGLTKREKIAAMAMQGLMSNPERYKYISKLVEGAEISQEEATRKNAHKAVLIADALLQELENTE